MRSKQEIISTLEGEKERVLDVLVKCDPCTDAYARCLTNLSELDWALDRWRGQTDEAEPKAGAPAQQPETAAEPKPEHAETETPPYEEIPEIETKTYSKEEVREILGDAQVKHPELDIAALIQSFGVKQLSHIPAEKYPELLAKLDDAVGAIGNA